MVRDAAFWQRPEIVALLVEILAFLTGDSWSLEFRQEERPAYEMDQDYLDLKASFSPEHVALYSGGLDSAAGLANRLTEGLNNYLLVTVGHQASLHSRVNGQLKSLARIPFAAFAVGPEYRQSTLVTALQGGKSKRMRSQEKTQRSRAFLFCTAGMIAAKAYDLREVEVFENGVGAINLPLMSGMLDNGLATRGAHPTFLGMMTKLARHVAEVPIRFKLPFADKTKAQMLESMRPSSELAEWVKLSQSCVHTSPRVKGAKHCGCCPACIERRQAFHAAGVREDPKAYQLDILADPISNEGDRCYLNMCRMDALAWLEGQERPRRRLLHHLALTRVQRRHIAKITALQMKHADEVISTFGSPFAANVGEEFEP